MFIPQASFRTAFVATFLTTAITLAVKKYKQPKKVEDMTTEEYVAHKA